MSKTIENLLYESDNDDYYLCKLKDRLEELKCESDNWWETESDSDANGEDSIIVPRIRKRAKRLSSSGSVSDSCWCFKQFIVNMDLGR